MNPTSRFRSRLIEWYGECGRNDLPWRHTSDPYAILVSEMMLQQTQVQTVLDKYYQPFLKTFPTLSSLAKADLEDVRKSWQGLGYYRRAKFLHESAKQSAGILPDDVEGLMALPGVGRNTAHAVLAFAHHKPYPVMEANVKRVISRLFAIPAPTEKELWAHAFDLLDRDHPFDYNQAMMDLGAMVCKPKAPKCTACPASNICQGKFNPELYPAPKNKKITPIRTQRVLIVEDSEGLIYMVPRKTEFLQGLYQFVELAAGEKTIELNGRRYPKGGWKKLGAVEQVYSHFKQQAEVFHLHYVGAHQAVGWYRKQDLAQLPLSKKEQKILELLTKKYPA